MMNIKRCASVWMLAAGAVLASVGWLQVAVAADAGAVAVPVVKWSPHAVYKGRQINMGSTGARGWVDGSTIVVAHIYKDAPELAGAKKLIAPQAEWIESGQKYYEAWAQMKMAASEYWHYYGQKAMDATDGWEPTVPFVWTPLVPASEQVSLAWKTIRSGAAEAGKLPADLAWTKAGFDDSKWADKNAPVACSGGQALMRKAFTLNSTDFGRLRLRLLGGKGLRTKVYMNGTLVAETVNGDAKGYSPIDLPKEALGLLTKGDNVLAVSVESDGGAKIDVALEAAARR